MASAELQNLINQLNSYKGYTPKTEGQLREQAAGEYESYYNTLRQSAQQSFEKSDLALQQQREGLGASYDKQREASTKQYAQIYSQTDRQMLGRGMQRSSYGAQTLTNILQEGAEAQQAIGEAQTAAEGNIDAQRAQLAQQLSEKLLQYDANEQADVLARLRELQDQEYERGLEAQNRQDTIATQIYQMLYQERRDAVADAQFQQQMAAQAAAAAAAASQFQAQMEYQASRDAVADAQWREEMDFAKQQYADSQAKKSSSSSGGSGSSGSRTSSSAASSSSGMSWGAFLAALGANVSKATTTTATTSTSTGASSGSSAVTSRPQTSPHKMQIAFD